LELELTDAVSMQFSPKSRFLTGLIGRDILASRSPWLHEQEADALDLRLTYSLFDFAERGWGEDDLPKLFDALAITGFAGVNVTHPFKQMVVPLLDDLSEGARKIGAVNAVSFVGGKRTGFNTDVTGFAESFRTGLPDAALDHVVQIGCGGAGAATANALLDCGVKRLTLFDQDPAKSAELSAALSKSFGMKRVDVGADLSDATARADGIVNATPMGMAAYPGLPLPTELIEHRHWVADIVYFPLETALLREAARKGCRTLDGSGMVVHQAASAFEIFTGHSVDRARMLKSFVEFVSCPAIRAA
jgi:shikimate dehydrogenase